jgi:serine/threonine-protein kinase
VALASGTRLGPYEVVAQIGAGGMGEVYRARDTTLIRDVALKVLPDAFALDPDRLSRFKREAQVLASINHPHIAAIYGFEDSGGTHALVLELVDGPTLADRIAQGPIPPEEALPIARQITDGLEAAHEQGIIHRDLKPANIKLRQDGAVKVLDFGLAKAFDPAAASSAAAAAISPTRSIHATQAGLILGTAAYMAPEQARGKAIDKRADIWAFGVVLYEMLTGRQLFVGDTVTDVIAAVVTRDPDWATLPPATPPALRALLQRSLRKDPRTRLRDIGEARIAIEELMSGGGDKRAVESSRAQVTRVRTWSIAATTAAVTALVVGAAVYRASQRVDPPPPLVRATWPIPGLLNEAISVTKLAFVEGGPESGSQLFVRDLATADTAPLPGVFNALAPFFSPDGEWIAYFSRGSLLKVPVGGGPPTQLCAINRQAGGDWSGDRIVFADRDRGLFVVSADGGTPQTALEPATGRLLLNPSWLPGGRTVVYTDAGRVGTGDLDLSNARVMALSLEPGAKPVKIVEGAFARFVPPHALVFVRDSTLVASHFEPATQKVSGGAETLQPNVSDYAVSPTGTLVFPPNVHEQALTLEWVDRQNHAEPTGLPAQPLRYPRISPDGTRIVLGSTLGDRDLWVWDIGQKTLTRLTTAKGLDSYPVWTPDGRRVIYAAEVVAGNENLAMRAADGTGALEILLKSNEHETPYTMTPDGEWVIFRHEVPGEGTNLDILNLKTRDAKPLIATKFNERNAELSPDGRLLAYQSDETGRFEVYVRPFPNVDNGKKQVSNGGGVRPAWSRDGQRLFYETNSNASATMNVVERKGGGALEFGPPEVVFAMAPFAPSELMGRTYDVAADGRFLMPKRVNNVDETQGLTIIVNWASHLAANRE